MLSYFARHRTAANLLLVAMIVLGLAAAPNMRAQFFPDIVIDEVDIVVSWPGAGAEDVDAGIVQVLQPALAAVEGVDQTESRSVEGRATIEVQFEPGWNMSRASEDVQQAIDGITTLPEEAEEPRIRRSSWFDRVTDVVITGPVGVDQLGRFADEFVQRLFEVGVTRTTIQGYAAPQTLVEVPSLSLIRHDVTMREIADAIAGEAQTDPAGDVGAGSRVSTGTAKRSADEIAAIVLRSNPDGSKLSDRRRGRRQDTWDRSAEDVLRRRQPSDLAARRPVRERRCDRHPAPGRGCRRRAGTDPAGRGRRSTWSARGPR